MTAPGPYIAVLTTRCGAISTMALPEFKDEIRMPLRANTFPGGAVTQAQLEAPRVRRFLFHQDGPQHRPPMLYYYEVSE
jgi:hypothetical protein